MKMTVVGGLKMKMGGPFAAPGVLFTMLFFALHYGGFCAGHGVFLLELTSSGKTEGGLEIVDMDNLKAFLGPLVFLQMLYLVAVQAWEALPVASLWSVVSLFAMRGLGFFQDFIFSGKWKETDVKKLMFEPYKNIIALHIAIVFGAGLAMAFKGAWPVLALIVVGKLVMDFMNLRKQEVELGN